MLGIKISVLSKSEHSAFVSCQSPVLLM